MRGMPRPFKVRDENRRGPPHPPQGPHETMEPDTHRHERDRLMREDERMMREHQRQVRHAQRGRM